MTKKSQTRGKGKREAVPSVDEKPNSVELEAERIVEEVQMKWAEGQREVEDKIKKFDGLRSIYSLAHHYPGKLKDFIEELVACDDEGAPILSDSAVLKTLFLYFYELMGIQQASDLKGLVTKSLSFKREQEWDKYFQDQKPESLVNFDRL